MIDARRGSDRFAAVDGRRAQTVGVALLNSTHAVDTFDLDELFAWVPPPGLGRGGNPKRYRITRAPTW